MRFTATKIENVFVVEPNRFDDNRGFFARAFCREEFKDAGLNPNVAQCNLSFNDREGTLRGLHYQLSHAAEAKVVRCVRGALYDVAVDLRPESSTYRQHFAIELTEDNGLALYIPERFAHGYQTLTDDTTVFYHVSEPYTPDLERGIRYNDPILDIPWPRNVSSISSKDQQWPLMSD